MAMGTTVSCTCHYIVLKGTLFERDSYHHNMSDSERCPDCGVVKEPGMFHHPGCDQEICPRCGDQLLSCGCSDRIGKLTSEDTLLKRSGGEDLRNVYAMGIPLKSIVPRIRKENRGTNPGCPVLEIGPGSHPDSRATHAVEITPQKWLDLYRDDVFISFSDMTFIGGIDLNTMDIPFPEHMFCAVISSHALWDMFGTDKTMNEIHRVLTEDGVLVIIVHDEHDLKKKSNLMAKYGFPKPHLIRKRKIDDEDGPSVTEYSITGRQE